MPTITAWYQAHIHIREAVMLAANADGETNFGSHPEAMDAACDTMDEIAKVMRKDTYYDPNSLTISRNGNRLVEAKVACTLKHGWYVIIHAQDGDVYRTEYWPAIQCNQSLYATAKEAEAAITAFMREHGIPLSAMTFNVQDIADIPLVV